MRATVDFYIELSAIGPAPEHSTLAPERYDVTFAWLQVVIMFLAQVREEIKRNGLTRKLSPYRVLNVCIKLHQLEEFRPASVDSLSASLQISADNLYGCDIGSSQPKIRSNLL